jgi:hypothetical protein
MKHSAKQLQGQEQPSPFRAACNAEHALGTKVELVSDKLGRGALQPCTKCKLLYGKIHPRQQTEYIPNPKDKFSIHFLSL